MSNTSPAVTPPAAISAFEKSLFAWLVHKYGYVGIDENGLSIFQIAPNMWEQGDYDFVVRWNEFMRSEIRPLFVMRGIVEYAREIGINTMAVDPLFPIEKKPMGWFGKVALGLAAAAGGWWLLKPAKYDHLSDVPAVDTKPAEDLLIDLARERIPSKRARQTTQTTTFFEEETGE